MASDEHRRAIDRVASKLTIAEGERDLALDALRQAERDVNILKNTVDSERTRGDLLAVERDALAVLLKEAAPHVFRQQAAGKHEQDRKDALDLQPRIDRALAALKGRMRHG